MIIDSLLESPARRPSFNGSLCLLLGIALAWIFGSSLAMSATYFASPQGSDQSNGSASSPWRTIQHAANNLQPGDTLTVRPGAYPERVRTARSGGPGANRIRFRAEGGAELQGWLINHANITLEGFHVTGFTATSVSEARVRVNAGGHSLELLDCTFRDAVHITRSDMRFNAADRTITTAQGGFLAAGFAPGQTIYVGGATNGLSINSANSGISKVTAVTDNVITVAEALVDQGPMPIYLSAYYQFGIHFHGSSTNALMQGNRFRNLGYDAWYINGGGHLIVSNVIESVNGWDAMHFGGRDHVFRSNVIRNSPLYVFQNSPDAMENDSLAPYSRVVFTNNFIYGFSGVLSSQKGSGTSVDLLVTHNVFVDAGRFNLSHPGTTFEHNTFLRVARQNTPVVSVARHAITVNSAIGAEYVTIRNNVFLDCGQATGAVRVEDVGWYEVNGPADTLIAEGNFVAGSPPTFPSKRTFRETNTALNGGDPRFANISDPVGPDGIPFTDDDGLRPLPDSKLIGAGVGGRTIGAYSTPAPGPIRLATRITGRGTLEISWPRTSQIWRLQIQNNLTGDWSDYASTPEIEQDQYKVSVDTSTAQSFFRLVR
jgi:hypothetical protein